MKDCRKEFKKSIQYRAYSKHIMFGGIGLKHCPNCGVKLF